MQEILKLFLGLKLFGLIFSVFLTLGLLILFIVLKILKWRIHND